VRANYAVRLSQPTKVGVRGNLIPLLECKLQILEVVVAILTSIPVRSVCDILRLLMIKVDVAENVALRHFSSLELIDGVETDRNLSNHRVLELAVDCVDV
jgi:hypothetical protein